MLPRLTDLEPCWARIQLALGGLMPMGVEGAALPYGELAGRLGQSEGALRTATSRLRSRWRRRLRELVAETVGEASEIGEELRILIAAVEK